MATYMGQTWSRAELLAYVGNMRQLAGIKSFEYSDGLARGSRAFHVYNGSGMSFDVVAERALDVTRLHYRGLALAWTSATDIVHPAYYEAEGLGWLRTFPGGLFTTCGLDQFGSPAHDDGDAFGIHGRISNLPAEQVSYREFWQDDDYLLEINGQVRQARLFGENLVLRRRIWTQFGQNMLHIEDSVTNEGYNTQPHMILYHCNLGFPLLNAQSTLTVNTESTLPRDAAAEHGINQWQTFQPPTAGYSEQVFRHVVLPDDDGVAHVNLHNPTLGLSLTLHYSHDTLPHLFQWKMMGQGAYVLGIEPANSSAIEGRSIARDRNDLPHLEPGETRHYRLSFEINKTE